MSGSADVTQQKFRTDNDPRSVAPFLPVSMDVLHSALANFQHHVGEIRKPFLELGSGDGRACILAAKLLKVQAFGLELDSDLVEEAGRAANIEGVGDLCEFKNEDLNDLSWAVSGRWGAVFLHLLPDSLQQLQTTLMGLDCPIICIKFLRYFGDIQPFASGQGWEIYNVVQNRCSSSGGDRAELLFA